MRPLQLITALFFLTPMVGAAQPGSGITFSGDARMGVVWESNPSLGPAENGMRLTSRTRLRLHFERQTDSGMAFGGTLRLDEATGRLDGGAVYLGAPQGPRNNPRD